jgi:uncharacterized phage-associated protein
MPCNRRISRLYNTSRDGGEYAIAPLRAAHKDRFISNENRDDAPIDSGRRFLWEGSNAKGSARATSSSRRNRRGRNGGAPRDRRDNRKIERAFGQGAVWKSWGEGARGIDDGCGAFGCREEGRCETVGMMPCSAKAMANAILNKANEKSVPISPLKLQKLLYYACGYYLAVTDQPLIDRAFEAWDNGPVVPEIYREFSEFRAGPITRLARKLDPVEFEFKSVPIPTGDQNISRVLDFVWDNYSQYGPLQLSDMTHRDGSPWDITRKNNPGIKDADIPNDLIKRISSKLLGKMADFELSKELVDPPPQPTDKARSELRMLQTLIKKKIP